MLNVVPVQADARQPRGLITINDIAVKWVSFEVTNNNHYQADTFRVELPLNQPSPELNPNYWASVSPLLIQVYAGFPTNPEFYTKEDLKSLILGEVDDVDFDPVNTRIVLSGRNLVSRFIDNKTTEGFDQLTASQIAEKLAMRRGLKAKVIKTASKVGKFYNVTQTLMTNQRTEWDLLTFLADQEFYSVFVKEDTLYFQPRASADSDPYVITWEYPNQAVAYARSNAIDLRFSRSLTLAKDVIVSIRSWNSKNKKGFTTTVRSKRNKKTRYSPGVQQFSEIKPNLTREQALQYAQSLLRTITQHEIKLNAEMLADNVLTIENLIQVKGTHSVFDQTYYPDSITRRMSAMEGYRMTVNAKNHSTESTLLV